MRYSYHGRNKQRIRAGELDRYYFTTDYPGIGEALVLVFHTYPALRPVRPHKYQDYVDILVEWNRAKKERPEGGASRRSVPGLAFSAKSENNSKFIISQFSENASPVREEVKFP